MGHYLITGAATGIGAARHLGVVHGIACIGTLAADLRAGTANDGVNAGATQHRVGAGGARQLAGIDALGADPVTQRVAVDP